MDDLDQNTSDDVLSLWPFAASAAAGLVIGLERRYAGAALGLKGFVLIAVFGTLIALVAEASGSAVVVAAGLVVVGVAGAAAALAQGSPSRIEVLTVVNVVWCFALGAATWYGYTQASLLLAVASAVMLRLSAPHGGLALRWSAQDVAGTVQFVVLAIALLPFAPDQEYGPYGALNPYHVWLVAVLSALLSWLGFAALRLRGSPGVLMSGLAAGAVSPAVTTALCARAAAQDAAAADTAAATVGLASLGSFIRIGLVAVTVMPRFLSPVGALVGATVLIALPLLIARSRKAPPPSAPLACGNPVRLAPVLGFALVYCACLLAIAWLVDETGRRGLIAFTLLSGFAPGGAAGIAALHLGSIGDLGARAVVLAFGCALLSMLAAQLLIARRLAGMDFARRCGPGLVFAAVGVCVGTAIALALVPAES